MSAKEKTLSAVPDLQNLNIIERLSLVMSEVGAVKKDGFNTAQKFNFRGVDAVVNAVSPVLQKYGIVVLFEVLEESHEQIAIGSNRTMMGWVRLKVKYRFKAPDLSEDYCIVVSESMDSGDKATAKAMSVAYRTMFLQALCLPTDEPDPDESSHERSDGNLNSSSENKPSISQDALEKIKERMIYVRSLEALSLISNELKEFALNNSQYQEMVDLYLKQSESIKQNGAEGATKDINSDGKSDPDSQLPTLDAEGFKYLSDLFENAPTLEVLAGGIAQARGYDMLDSERTRLVAMHNVQMKVLQAESGK